MLKFLTDNIQNCLLRSAKHFHIVKGNESVEFKCPAFRSELELRREKLNCITQERKIKYADLQACFDQVTEHINGDLYSADGIHPTPAGHTLINNEQIKLFRQLTINE